MGAGAGQPIATAFVEVRPEVGDFRAAAESQIQQQVQSVPVGAQLQIEGLEQATSEMADLASTTTEVGTAAADAATTISGIAAVTRSLAGSRQQAAAAAELEAAAVRRTVAEEDSLFRVRAARGRQVGLFRIAGVGLGVGTAVVAATRLLGEARTALEVTGEEAETFGGRMRNLGASLLGGDIVGAFQALARETNNFTAAELRAIAITPELAQKLRDLGVGADLAKAALAGLAGVGEVPVGIQLAQERAEGTGDIAGQTAAIEDALVELERQEALVQQAVELGISVQESEAALLEIERQRNTLKQQRETLLQGEASAPARRGGGGGATGAEDLAALRAERDALQASAAQRDQIATELAQTAATLATIEARIADAQRQVAAGLGGEAGLDALVQAQARAEATIRAKQGAIATFADLPGQLSDVDRRIEEATKSLAEEQVRHEAEMRAARIQTFEIAVLEAQAFGGNEVAALKAEEAAIRELLASKQLSADERQSLLSQLIGVNSQLEALAREQADAERQHQEEMAQAREERAQAFQEGIATRESGIRNQQLLAEGTQTLNDDIRVAQQLQELFRQAIAEARRAIADAQKRASVIAQLTGQLIQAQATERDLRRQRQQERRERQRESVELDVQIAQASGSRGAEIRAREAEIAFIQRLIAATRRGSLERKRLILELRQSERDLRELRNAGKKDADEAARTARERADAIRSIGFSALQAQQGFAANLLSNLIPFGQTGGLVGQTSPPQAGRPGGGISPFITDPGLPPGVAGGRERADQEQQGFTNSQAVTVVSIERDQLATLRQIARGLGFPEAREQVRRGNATMDIR